jgi:hypothetical protein
MPLRQREKASVLLRKNKEKQWWYKRVFPWAKHLSRNEEFTSKPNIS